MGSTSTLVILEQPGRGHNKYSSAKVTRTISKLLSREESEIIDIRRCGQIYGIYRYNPHVPSVEHEVTQRLTSFETITVDRLAALVSESCALFSDIHPLYEVVAGRLELKRIYSSTAPQFSDFVLHLEKENIFNNDFVRVVKRCAGILDGFIQENGDDRFNFFNIRCMVNSCLLKVKGLTVERPQYLFMRVAIALHGYDLTRIKETYSLLADGYYIHDLATLRNAGLRNGQLSSSFQEVLEVEPSDGIYRTLARCSSITGSSGDVGLSMTDFPSTMDSIHGESNSGLGSLTKLFNASLILNNREAQSVGTITAFTELWHKEIFEFLADAMTQERVYSEDRTLMHGLWVSDLFMTRIKDAESWCLFNPKDVPGLSSVYGDEFDELYVDYEADKTISKQKVPAKDLWNAILECQVKTGGPYMVFKDSVNCKNNQKNLGAITHSDSSHIMQFSSDTETGVCSLASILLPAFVSNEGFFDFKQLRTVVQKVVWNLNCVVNETCSPDRSSRYGNRANRALGIGVQGLADVYTKLGMKFDSIPAKTLNLKLAQAMYYAALEASIEIASVEGTYPSYPFSPAAEGTLQIDLWSVKDPPGFDWDTLRRNLGLHGLANSTLIGLTPTVLTSRLTGCSESVHPSISNVQWRHDPESGVSYQVISLKLVSDLMKAGLWNEELREEIISSNGSIQDIMSIPIEIREVYQTVLDVNPKVVIDQAVDRGPFVCHSQDLSLFIKNSSPEELESLLLYGWGRGLKTGLHRLIQI